MKKLICCSMLLIFVLLCGCSSNTLSVGNYVLKNTDEPISPYVLLKEDNKFVFMYSSLSSNLPQGTYSIDKNKLILTTDDNKYTYVFKISDKTIIFIADKSSEIPLLDKEVPVKDGDTFIKK